MTLWAAELELFSAVRNLRKPTATKTCQKGSPPAPLADLHESGKWNGSQPPFDALRSRVQVSSYTPQPAEFSLWIIHKVEKQKKPASSTLHLTAKHKSTQEVAEAAFLRSCLAVICLRKAGDLCSGIAQAEDLSAYLSETCTMTGWKPASLHVF